MTGSAPGQPRPAGRPGSGGPAPLSGRPLLTTPPHLQDQRLIDLQRQRLAAQPWLGLGGVLLGAAVFFALALGTGSTATSLPILGPISTFALPAAAAVAFWWNDWPGSRLTTPWTGLIDTALVAAAAVVLTIAGQAIVERPDVRAVFEASPGPGAPTTFPATLPLAGAAFTAMLQLSLVCERWPLGGTGRIKSGIAALALSWVAGTGAYFLLVNTDAVPAAERAASGLRNPGGPLAAPGFGVALITVGLWQAVFFLALRGWHVNTITRRPARLLAGNALVIGLGALTYLVLRDLAHWQLDAISAACGCVISATLIVAMLFEGWPAARLRPAPGRALTLALTALVALALDRALTAYADSVCWTRATPNEWITTAALSFIGAGIILHVGIGLRWPFAPQDHGGAPMTSQEPSNPVVARLVAAINDGDRDAFLATLTPDATLTDDGNPRSLTDWIDREIFTTHGHLTIERDEEDGLHLLARYRNDTWGEMSTYWRFQVTGNKISRIDTGQA